jgi:predicted DNA-binding protein with PD1-like motif
MKKILEHSGKIILRFDRGEELVSALTAFIESEHHGAGSFSALGATDDVIVSFYNLQKKVYEDTRFRQNMEVVNLTGNVSYHESKPLVHMHGSFSGPDLKVIGGHVKRLMISATCEVVFFPMKGLVKRKYDEETGLNLMA